MLHSLCERSEAIHNDFQLDIRTELLHCVRKDGKIEY